MNIEEAKELVNNREPDFLQLAPKKINGENSYICPVCGNGSGSDGTGLWLNPKITKKRRYVCFKCNTDEDIIGWWKLSRNISSDSKGQRFYGLPVEEFKALCSYYGLNNIVITEDDYKHKHTDKHTYTHTHKDKPKTTTAEQPKQREEQTATDYSSFINEAHNKLFDGSKESEEALLYLKGRGLSTEIIKQVKLGFASHWLNPNSKSNIASARIIIPVDSFNYTARSISDNRSYSKIKVGINKLFNYPKLYIASSEPVFVVEGELDAISIEQVGAKAVALRGTAYNELVEEYNNSKQKHLLILATDNDEAGKSASKKILKILKDNNIPCVVADNLYRDYKDANEFLAKEPTAFAEAVAEALKQAENEADKEKNEYILSNSSINDLRSLINTVNESVNKKAVSTGFKALDMALDGGLYEGLYFIGAISSLGKTTFALQLVEQIARQGKDVMIFSLEMSKSELIAKSLSRLTYTESVKKGVSSNNAKTMRGIVCGSRYSKYNETEHSLIDSAIAQYSEYAKHIYIIEGVGNIGADDIKKRVAEHIEKTGNTPVVLIDYVQILAPFEVRATDKQNTDKAVLELKRMSRDLNTSVIGISSLNRDNYKKEISMEAFKESGAIEYSADVLIGLQLYGVGEKEFNLDEAKKREVREIELKILKNRNGRTNGKIQYNYYTMFNYFEEYETIESSLE